MNSLTYFYDLGIQPLSKKNFIFYKIRKCIKR